MRKKVQIMVFVGFMLSVFGWAEEAREWPKMIKTPQLIILIYQPQADRLDGDKLYARAAVSIARNKEELPVFGAIWIETRIETDPTTRMVSFRDLTIPKVYFTEATADQQQKFIALLKKEIPTWEFALSQDRLMAMLKDVERKSSAIKGFNDTPPKIIFVEYPTVLVTLDGEPKFAAVEGTAGIEKVLNTPFLIFRKDKQLYLSANSDTWYTANSIFGSWAVLGSVPKEIKVLASSKKESTSQEKPTAPPAILVVSKPTELVVMDGKPQLKPIKGNELMLVSNSDAPLFVEIKSQYYFVLLSGRWFSSKSLKDSWAFVPANQLPTSFAKIPLDSDAAEVRTWVAGTKESEEAVLEASIPQTAAIRRDATITVKYDGQPQFKKISGTTLKYAINTDSQVIGLGDRFFCAKQGAWYVASSATGSWITATKIPDEIQQIPASCPVFNVSYLYVYGFNDDVVFFGYYPGYTSSYVYHETVVYGTGYYYQPWCHRHCYFRPCTWGYLMRWHIWHGWGSGCRYMNTRYQFGLQKRRNRTQGLWGPSGYQKNLITKNKRPSQLSKIQARKNLYQRTSNANRVVRTRNPRIQNRARVAKQKQNNLYVDKNKKVVRRTKDGQWQHREKGKWVKTRPQQPQKNKRPVHKKPPIQKKQPRNNLDYEVQKRQHGRELQNRYKKSYQAPIHRGGGGGGGRRR